MGKINILIADDHELMRDGTRRILEEEPDMKVIGEAADGLQAVELASSLKPDVIILDISMPQLDGIEAARRIKTTCTSTAVLILTAYDDDEFVFSLVEAGAAGYLLKTVRSHELVDAVRAVYSGESVLHPTVARKVLNHFVSDTSKKARRESLEILSNREMDIMRLVIRGLTNKEIADELCLSMRTVQGHLGSIFGKLQVGSRTEAVIRVLKEGWLTLDDIPENH